ncbi:MAG: hypothetical protein Q9191_005809 [Dirinaria sp. TL-2023a]
MGTSAEISIGADKFTPEVLLSAPRRSAAVPNAKGTLALYTVTTYSFESHRKTSEIRAINIFNGQSTLITNDEHAGDPHWLGDGNELIWLKAGGNENGKEASKTKTDIVVGSVDEIGKEYTAATVCGSIADIKLKALDQERIAFAFVAKVRPEDGSMFNPDDEPKRYTSGKLYDSVMVRHWDKYVTPQRNTIWYGLLQRDLDGRYKMLGPVNALKGSPLESPIAPFGGADHFDLSTNGIIFVAKDPALSPAFNTKCDFYYVPIEDYTKAPSSMPRKAQVKGLEGAATSPVFSPEGNSAAYLKMKQNGYESDKNRIILVPDLSKLSDTVEVLSSDDGKGLWDRSPGGVRWSNDGKMLLLQAEESGRGLLFKLAVPISPPDLDSLPEPVTKSGYLSNTFPLAANSSELLVSSTNLVDNSVYTIIDPANPASARQISSNSRDGSSFSLSKDQISEIWFPGAKQKVHAWVIKPSDFNSSHQYPLAYMIHGGPQAAWGDEWSTRWNPAVFAEQGYVVVTPNPTGSTGYGQAFCDAIQESWGGLPYQDLVNGFDYIKENLAYVDTDRAVALGASYGGYMINWMQGNDLGRKFKALVCHDGVFSMANQMSSDEQYFPNHDMGGAYYDNMAVWQKWDPARLTGNWSTPQLIIHNELDYRLPISEGLAAFNILQEQGVDSRFLTFPDENHWVLNEENSLLWHTVVFNWINQYVGLPPYKEDQELGYVMQSSPVAQSDDQLTKDIPAR